MALYASSNGFQSIPTSAWTLVYWLCYLNSTLNPACYAACNKVIIYTEMPMSNCNKQRSVFLKEYFISKNALLKIV